MNRALAPYLLPHGVCFQWESGLLGLHVVSDVLIALAYFSIPWVLMLIARRRPDLQFRSVFVMFSVFILACGCTHVASVWVIWHPSYWAEGYIKAFTALASVMTAVVLWPLIPRVLAIPSPVELHEANERLAHEIVLRGDAQNDLRQAYAQLEDRVHQRTFELAEANERLMREVEQRRRTEDALRRALELQSAILATSPDAIVTMDHEGHIVEFSAAAERMFGHRAEEVRGRTMHDMMVPEHLRAAHLHGFATHLRTGATRMIGRRAETLALSADGTLVPIEVAVTRLPDQDPPVFAAFIRDIRERRSTEHALKASEARLSGIVQSALDAILTVDKDQHVVLFNRAAEHTFGVAASDAIGKPLARFIPQFAAVGRATQVRRFGVTATDPNKGGSDVLVGLRNDGTEIPLEASISVIAIDGERLTTIIVRDVTERIRAEQRIRELNEDLEERVHSRTAQLSSTVRELEAFSYTVSHDLRAPLRAIDGFASVLLEDHGDQLDVSGKMLLARVSKSARQMGQLIDGLLEFSRLGRAELQVADVDMQAMVASVIDEIRVDQRGAVQIDCGPLPIVRGDPLLLRQVWVNLIGNAVKFSAKSPAPHVRIEASVDVAAMFSVSDNGVGFDMAHSDKLFGVFQRLHSVTEFDGTGVGLAIVRRIIERHGGRVWADSRPGYGARFTFVLKRP